MVGAMGKAPMDDMNASHHLEDAMRIFRKTTAGGLVLLLVLAGWPAAAEGKIKLDWSKVQALTPGTGIKVGLYKDQAPRGSRKIQGRFHSATDDSITLTLKDGQTLTLQRSAVRKVHTRRGDGWFPLGVILWSRVQAVTPGTRTTVVLYKDQAPRGSRKIKGQFHSSTDDSITLTLKDGKTRTIQKPIVRKVLVYRPFKKRYLGWITAAVSSAVWLPLLLRPAADLTAWAIPVLAIPVIVLPTTIALLVTSKEKIYSVSPKHRTRPQGDKQSGFIDLFWPGVLIVEQKSAGRDLARAYGQAGEYSDSLSERDRPRYYPGQRLPELRASRSGRGRTDLFRPGGPARPRRGVRLHPGRAAPNLPRSGSGQRRSLGVDGTAA